MKVILLDSLGSDLTIVNSARVSFNKVSEQFTERDKKLIKYLADHNHWTPFSSVQYQVRITAPIFVARQWFKHQIGISRNEISRRYVNDPPEFYKPDHWRSKVNNKKQGSGPPLKDTKHAVQNKYDALMKGAARTYRRMLELGVAEEQARMVLPQSMMTEWIETGSLAAAARIVSLRNHADAQIEIQQLAKMFEEEVKQIAPYAWEQLMKQEE